MLITVIDSLSHEGKLYLSFNDKNFSVDLYITVKDAKALHKDLERWI